MIVSCMSASLAAFSTSSSCHLAILDIVHDGVIEEHSVLRNNTNTVTQGTRGEALNVLTTKGDLAGIDIKHPYDQFSYGGLSTSRGSNQGSGGSSRDCERHILQNWF